LTLIRSSSIAVSTESEIEDLLGARVHIVPFFPFEAVVIDIQNQVEKLKAEFLGLSKFYIRRAKSS
jgi:hypothetical protein